jgi:hypothetical protein
VWLIIITTVNVLASVFINFHYVTCDIVLETSVRLKNGLFYTLICDSDRSTAAGSRDISMIANQHYDNVYMNILIFVQFSSIQNYIKSLITYPLDRNNWGDVVKASMAACLHGTCVRISL